MTPHLARIRVFPVKSLDPLDLDCVRIVGGTRLGADRDFALFDKQGRPLNAKRLRGTILAVRARYSRGGRVVALEHEGRRGEFDLTADPRPVEGWLGRALGQPVALRRDSETGFPDDRAASGPTILGTASIESVAGWFDLPSEEVRRRFRANLEIAGLDPFEEDLLFGPPGQPLSFRIGEVEFLGTNPCARCVVPTLDSCGRPAARALDARRFASLRERHPCPGSAMDGYTGRYRLAVNTVLPPGQDGRVLRVGDPLAPLPGDLRSDRGRSA